MEVVQGMKPVHINVPTSVWERMDKVAKSGAASKTQILNEGAHIWLSIYERSGVLPNIGNKDTA